MVSPLIVLSLPLLLVIGPLAVAWRRNRARTPRLERLGRNALIGVSTLLAAGPILTGIFFITRSDSGMPVEAEGLIGFGFFFVPFMVASFNATKI